MKSKKFTNVLRSREESCTAKRNEEIANKESDAIRSPCQWKMLDALLAELCWWNQKICQHEDEGTEEDEGYTASSYGDDTDSDDEQE
ncbi:hypothetical protein FQA39_LY11196 [Lamprigera yunnana]|nr:hypothetical protein FQA39_LY11196 [Lamprigera yunnana]